MMYIGMSGSEMSEVSVKWLTYEPAGHVFSGDLAIIRNAKLCALGPSYREQNPINWKLN